MTPIPTPSEEAAAQLERTDSEAFTTLLGEILSTADTDELDVTVESVATFRDAGVLTMNNGLVVRLASGEEFQITVVASR